MANTLAIKTDTLAPIFDAAAALERTIETALAGADVDLTVNNLRLLRFIRDAQDNDKPLTMAMLAALMIQQHHSVSGQLNRLAARGLVERQPNPADLRSAFAVLTPAGRELVVRAEAIYSQVAGATERYAGRPALLELARRMMPLAGVDLIKRVEARERLGQQ